jgi:hypothetical protein
VQQLRAGGPAAVHAGLAGSFEDEDDIVGSSARLRCYLEELAAAVGL